MGVLLGHAPGRASRGVPSTQGMRAALLLAAALVVALLLGCATPAWGLSTDRTTARGTNSSGDEVLAGVATRFTWEGTVGEDEELSSISFSFPEGTQATEDTSVEVTVLDGLDRLDVAYDGSVDSAGARVAFGEPVASGLLVRVEIQKLVPPDRAIAFSMGVSYVAADGAEVELGQTPSIQIVEQGVVEDIVSWLDGQAWVEAWNSNKFLNLFFNPQVAVQAAPDLFVGWLRALGLVLIGFPLAIPLGFALAFMRMSGIAVVRGLAGLYVNVVRGTPLFLQIYIYFFGLPLLGINIDSFVLGFCALALNSGAYLCEIFRAGIQSIPKGQFEAARSLGMTAPQTMFSVIIPQSVRRVIPTATSEFILLYKDTSLLASVGVMELMMFSKSLTSTTGNITPYIVAACYYLIVTLPLTKLIGSFEKRLAARDGVRPDGPDASGEPGQPIGLAVAAAQTGDVTPVVIQNATDESVARSVAASAPRREAR